MGSLRQPRILVMSSIETLSPGVAQSGVADQYADGVAAQNWLLYIGEQENRTTNYKNFLCNLLKEKKCYTILDAACGTGVDSVMLIEEMGAIPAFSLTSCDFSDKMLKYALKLRWERRREQAFFDWTIEEGNWMTLNKDVKTPGAGYDSIICMGNSFPHLMDDHGDFRDHKRCIQNMYDMLKPGGILIIDHRNYDYILKNGQAQRRTSTTTARTSRASSPRSSTKTTSRGRSCSTTRWTSRVTVTSFSPTNLGPLPSSPTF